ncbi:MAG: PIN domain-containing protein [Nitrospirae bacterium]|nr:PIN domain-containing protein [Nitrospirota bacterium]
MTGDKVFLDTNILIYAYDTTAGKKHELSKGIVVDLWNSGLGHLSTQVLQEFFVAMTRKIPKPVSAELAKDIIKDLLKWDVVIADGDSILDAIEIHIRYKFSFWDSMVIGSAIKAGAGLLLSEDLSDKQEIEGLKIKNPFK